MSKYIRVSILLVFALVTALISFAQTGTPDGILFQAVARDANGNAAIGRTVYAKVSILKGSATGTAVYTENFQVLSTSEGIFTIVIGKGTGTTGAANINSIDWASSNYFLNIQLAVSPTVPDPNWTAANNFIDIGTSQFWNVPYALVSGRSLSADSATTISSILPSTKGGTGINNNGKTISISNNVITRGVGDLTITTTAASNVIFPTSGTLATLAGTEVLTNKTITSPLLNGRPVTITQDTATADSTIATTLYVSKKVTALAIATGATSGAKLNLSDTAAMLSNRIGRDTISLSNRINAEATRATTAEAGLTTRINSTNASLTTETSRAINAETVLQNNITSNNNSITAETTRALAAEAGLTTRINSTNSSLTAETTRAIAAEALKVNIADTALMLSSRFARDTASLSNRINVLTASSGGNLNAEITRATNAENAITASVTAEVTRALNAETTLSNRITSTNASLTAETSRALNAETVLQNNITSNTNSITAETNRAVTAEAALNTSIGSTNASLTAEVTRAMNAETTLSNRITSTNASLTAETARALNAETVLQNNITSNTNSITAETNRAVTAEAALNTSIGSTNASLTAEITRATNAETTLSNRITSATTSITANTASITVNTSDIALRATIASPAFTGTPTAPTAAVGNNSTQIATTAFVAATTAAATPDASVTVKGKIQLSNDLGGTAAAPVVNSVGGVSSATIATLPTLIASNTNSITTLNTNLVTLSNKEIIDSTTLRNLIENNISTINTNLLKEQTDSLTLVNRIIADSSILRGLINTNTSDIAVNTTNIANNSINISQNATDIAANTLAINNRVQYTDMPAALLPYLKTNDTLSMLAVYKAAMIDHNTKVAALITDTASLITRFGFKEEVGNKSTSVSADGTSDTKYPSVKAVKDFVDNAITASTPDATTTVKGKIKLAGDLTGIAAAPTVNSVGGSSSTTIHTAEQLANAATELNTNNAIVKRDNNGDFSAGNITASLTGNVTGNVNGNATTATTLAGARSIYGNSFNGSADLSQVIAPNYGGTGVDNGTKTITLGGNILTANSFTTTGNYSTTLNSVGVTNITLPTSGTIATLSGTETMTNKSLVSPSLTGIPTAPTAASGTNTNQIATTAFVLTTTAAATPDATDILKGKIKLAGDLSGTADLPTVKTFAGVNTATMATINTTITAATSSNTSNSLVKRDVTGNFSAGIITASLNGNANTATTLATARNIYGNTFDGNADLTQAIAGNYGGTGVDNGNKTITLGGNIVTANSFTTAGNYSTTLTSTGVTNVTLPTTGTIATVAGTETFTNKTIVDVALTGVPTAPTATAGTNTNQVATTAFVSAATPDAASTVKGKIQLAGDLAGTAAAPSVATVGGSAAADIHSAEQLANAATNNSSSSTIVKRDASGNFSAGTITANLIGTATNVTGIVAGANGGTGVANAGKTITLGGNINTGRAFTTTGTTGSNASDITLKTTASTNVTLPTTGVLATIDGTENLTNKTVNGLTLAPAAVGFSIAGGTTSKTITLTDNATVAGTNTGDQTITLTGDVTGTGTGTFSTTLANSGVTAGVYGGATTVPTISIDAKGRIISAANTTITGVSSIGSLLESAKIIVGDVNNQAAKVDMTGDITIDNNGTTTIGANKVTTQTILNSNVTYDKIQNVSASNKILGRVSTGAGKVEEISTTGTGNVVRAISPSFSGTPKVPTASYPSNDSTIASTQYVTTAINNISGSQITGVIAGANGGTGVNNAGKTITLGRNLTTTGTTGSNASDITFKTTGATTLILPTSGTLATLSDLSGSTLNGSNITGVINPVNGGTGVANDNSYTITLGGALSTSGNVTIAPATGTNASDATLKTTGTTVVVLPTSGVLATLDGTETLTSKTIDGAANTITGITNSAIASNAAIDDSKLATIAGSGKVANSATTATAANTNNAIVARDANGAFSAGTITATLNGNAGSATKLATPRSIYGTNFDGTAALTGIIASTYGGTGNGFTKFTGPATTERVFTLPNASATILTTAAAVTVAQGGTGVTQATQNFVFAGPATGSSAGAPTFRALTPADLPSGSGSYIGNTTTQQANANFNISGSGIAGGNLTAASFVVPTATSSQFLKGDGSLDGTAYATAGANTNITSITGLTTALDINQGGTGSTTRNFVDLTSSEIIAGAKTFSSDLVVNGLTVGKGANNSITTNTAVGKDALANALTGAYNTAIGYKALNANNASGIGNTAVGANALYLSTGQKNTAIGEYALTAVVNGTDNTAVGDYALSNNLGSQNTALGSGAGVATANLSNTTAIGYGASATASNTVQLGNTNVTNVKTSGNITAGTVTFPNTHNSVANQVLSIDAAGNATFKTIDGAGANLTNGKILVGNSSNIATAVNLTGDVTMTNAGVVSITSNAVTYGKIQAMGAKTILGNKSSTTAGTPGEIILGTGLNLDPTTGILTASVSSGGSVTKIMPVTLSTTGSTYTSTVASSTSTPTININIPLASSAGATAGLLSNADYAAFSAKQNPLTLGTGVSDFLATPTSANLSAAVSDETGSGALVFASSPTLNSPTLVTPTLGVATATSLTLATPLSVANGGIGTATVPANLVFAGPVSGADDAPTFRALTGADLPSGSGSYINSGTTQQTGASFNISGTGTVGGLLTAGSLSLTSKLTVANGGTGATSFPTNSILIGNGYNPLQGIQPGAVGNVLVSTGSTWTSAAAPAAGVSTVGTIAASSNAKGATISGTSIVLTPADVTNGGIVTNGAQTFAGTKTFANANVAGALVGTTVNSTLSGFNAALVAISADLTISAANAATYNGKVIVCSTNALTITFDATTPVGFSCMILQSDNNTVSFAGHNNRYNYTATSGAYAIATAMCYASGSTLLTGDLQ